MVRYWNQLLFLLIVLFFFFLFLHLSCLRITHFEFDPQREREGGGQAGRQTDRQSDRQAGRETALRADKRQ